MRLTRRGALAALAGAGAAALARPATAVEPPALVARPATARIAPEGVAPTPVWGYDGQVPGPAIRVRQGERVTRLFRNDLPQTSTVHWHGIRVPNEMDGVPGLTQETVAPGGTFLYDFAAEDAGTFWYHAHDRSWEQVARGLSAPLIVAEADGGPDVDADEVLLIDDWRLTDDGTIAEDFGALHDSAHGGRIGNWITVNGRGDWTRPVARHDRLRLRLINAANARILDLSVQGLEGWIAALDGMPLDAPIPLDRLILGPAQRADLILDVTAEAGDEAFLVSHERDGGYALAAFPVAAGPRARRGAPAALPPNPVPALGDLATARRAEVLMEGGAMGRLEAATLAGERLALRDLAARGKVWALNGRADRPEAPLLTAAPGETVVLTVRNDTAWPHAMHLHGHHFRVLDGPAPGPLRDTHLVAPGATADLAFVAGTPGAWLFHCHMLEHAAAGMTTWLEVG